VNPIEAVVPARLGTSFRWLLASTVVGNIGDGVALAAGPLLVASQTHDPLLVAAAAFVQRLPWLPLLCQNAHLASTRSRPATRGKGDSATGGVCRFLASSRAEMCSSSAQGRALICSVEMRVQ